MHLPFLHPIASHPPEAPAVETPESRDPLRYSMEGSEFLDEGLRMEDLEGLPLARTEESIAAGTPENLL